MLVRILYFPLVKLAFNQLLNLFPNFLNPLNTATFFFAPDQKTLDITYAQGSFENIHRLQSYNSFNNV